MLFPFKIRDRSIAVPLNKIIGIEENEDGLCTIHLVGDELGFTSTEPFIALCGRLENALRNVVDNPQEKS